MGCYTLYTIKNAAQKKKSVFGKEKIMTGSIPDKGRREINMEVHRKNILLKVPTPVFVIPGVILFVVGMLLVILIWTPLNLWKFGTGLGANSILIMAGFLFAFGGLLMVVLGLAVRIQHEQLNYDNVSKYIVKRVSLERGATAGLVIFLAGFVYAIHLILVWVESRYKDLPTFEHEFAGITLLVIGLQMIIQTLGKFNQNASLFALS